MIITWPIIHWTQTGRLLGFPTANIALDEMTKSALTNTVSICIIDLDGTSYHGVGTYLPHKGVYEVHIFDFDQDIYGQTATITLVRHIRDNKRFDSDEDLKAQIAKDCAVAREYFSLNSIK